MKSVRRRLILAAVLLILLTGSVSFLELQGNGNRGITLTIGSPTKQSVTLSYGQGGARIIAEESFEIRVSSAEESNLSILLTGLPPDVWARLAPDNLSDVNSAGTNTTLYLVGAVEPAVPTSQSLTLTMLATDGHGNLGVLTLPVVPNLPTDVLGAVGPIYPAGVDTWTVDVNSSSAYPVGVLFDPGYPGAEGMSVTLSPKGVVTGNGIASFPPWLNASVVGGQFSLQPFSPQFFMLAAKVGNAPTGVYTLAFQENVDNSFFIVSFNVTVLPAMRG